MLFQEPHHPIFEHLSAHLDEKPLWESSRVLPKYDDNLRKRWEFIALYLKTMEAKEKRILRKGC